MFLNKSHTHNNNMHLLLFSTRTPYQTDNELNTVVKYTAI